MNQQTAQGLASLGRGSDSMLVHMAPEEVAGLQALALKHGGTLTINPETGLAEAGFLKKNLADDCGFCAWPCRFWFVLRYGGPYSRGHYSSYF